ncbi:DUF1120 domain-containing protein [Pseudomonas sp. MH9.3]|uniref:DUF1120 domain-containing protein n=1 Tax=Pseudomonas sp. MH9.3 TaxID=3048630 RepID=UPI002AC92051|nr:DUF1120 domain-containing protein [Pseudomonas sp. MH9.3]MEB0105986.1 DUF1120 domain-containing protein [Pseudomonas sp. MH9.3]WPX78777.1 DUF1120 domain-containing protein [Pseudomonas sp. MH9.3]WQG58831.1 DUF1120 domain-containing protein [Pseudomonas sp. RTB3]
MKRLNMFFAASVMASAGHAVAASSVDLGVHGLITPSACTPSLSGGGVIDHGKISIKDLNLTEPTLIASHLLTLDVNCEAATTLALHSIDNRVGSSVFDDRYGLGFIAGGQRLGHYTLFLANAIADNVAVQTIGSDNQGDTWYKHDFMKPGRYTSIATQDDASQVLPAKDLVVDLRVDTIIYRADNLNVDYELPIDGSATLEVKYL